MKLRYESVIVDLAVRILVPFIQIFALYVVTHGHYSPGGGFQGGAILAASILLLRLSLGQEHAARRFPTKVMLPLGGLGVLIYALNGVLVMPLGGNFLDYGLLPQREQSIVQEVPAQRHYQDSVQGVYQHPQSPEREHDLGGEAARGVFLAKRKT